MGNKHDDLRKRFGVYVSNVCNACIRHCHDDGVFAGEEGCIRLAREVGCAIPDFTKDWREINDCIQGTYSGICVICYNLKPPVDAKTWFEAMREGVRKAYPRQ